MIKNSLLICLLSLISLQVIGQKKITIPSKTGKGIDFSDPESTYANKRMRQTENFAIFWDKEYGDNPIENKLVNKRFDADRILEECERYFQYYVDQLRILKRGESVSDRTKILIFVTGGNEGTAYGGGQDSVGIMWTPASRVNKEPYGVLAHELGHTFQFLASKDNGGTSFNGPFNEMTAQYLLWQVLPDWLTFENFHLKAYLKNTHHAFLHQENAYHAPFMIEYWAELRGITFYGNMLREVKPREDAVMAYKRITKSNQEEFNDEIFDAARRFVTWDLERIQAIASPYRNQHHTLTQPIENGWRSIVKDQILEDYGYNAIALNIPNNSSNVAVSFKGLIDSAASKFSSENAGWRYGFVAYGSNGKRTYSKKGHNSDGNLKFKVPNGTQKLWLVVSSAPQSHRTINRKDKSLPKWPYRFKLTGTSVN